MSLQEIARLWQIVTELTKKRKSTGLGFEATAEPTTRKPDQGEDENPLPKYEAHRVGNPHARASDRAPSTRRGLIKQSSTSSAMQATTLGSMRSLHRGLRESKTFRSSANLKNRPGGALVITFKMKVQPRRGPIKFPHSGRDAANSHLVQLSGLR